MKVIKQAFQSDHVLEMIFSSLRWLFLVLSVLVFFYKYDSSFADLRLQLFIVLVCFGIVYMALSDICLHKTPVTSKAYVWMTKGSPIFDFVSFFALIGLTGGINSPLFPIAYLIILHVAVYWKFVGAIIASILFMLGYSIVFVIQSNLHPSFNFLMFSTQLIFLLLIGFLGGVVVSRERHHISEKNTFKNLANKDHLTNLYNHRSFQEQLKVAKEKKLAFFLVMADIDEFKKINDQYGHVVGDRVLNKIAKVLISTIPTNIGTVFRYGGEEFAILLYTDQYFQVQSLLKTVKEKVSEEIHQSKLGDFSVTMSFGCRKNGNEEPICLIEETDRLLYEAKRQGRNRIIYEEKTG